LKILTGCGNNHKQKHKQSRKKSQKQPTREKKKTQIKAPMAHGSLGGKKEGSTRLGGEKDSVIRRRPDLTEGDGQAKSR